MKHLALAVSILTVVFTGDAAAADSGKDILAATHTTGGLVVHLDCGDGDLTSQLCGEGMLVYGLDADPANVTAARAAITKRGVYGSASVGSYNGKTLPLVDNIATLVIADAPTVAMNEIMRVLHPYGSAYVGGKITVKEKPADTDEWPHYLNNADNNAVAHDQRIAPPRHMQFLSHPLWTRHHDRLSSFTAVVTAKGRLFYVGDGGPVFDPDESGQWTITARNAFNGVFLWSKPISSWTNIMRKFRSGPVQLQRLLVTDGDRVFVTLGLDEPISCLDAASGETIATFEDTAKAEEFVLDGGVLYVQIGELGAEHALLERRGDNVSYKDTKLIKAVEAETGRLLWRWPAEETAEIMPRTLAVSQGRVFFQDGGETVCLNAASGKLAWRSPMVAGATRPTATPAPTDNQKKAKADQRKKPKKKPAGGRSMGWTYATLVVQDGVVLSCDGGTIFAVDAKSGEPLWTGSARTPFGRTPSVDILVVDGVVWTSPGFGEGRDLRTGKIVATNDPRDELVTAGHHHRCYRNKATDRFVIEGYRGLEFHDLAGEDHCRNNWIRGVCQYGIMPANGMLYLPPHNCGCYPEAKLYGFWALKADESTFRLDELEFGSNLEKGPAFGTLRPPTDKVAEDEWPMHRRDARRGGLSPAAISADEIAWKVEGERALTAPVVAKGTLLVADKISRQVIAYEAATGEPQWTFAAGGQVDSPPTIFGNAVLFGAADGTVTCLNLDDGQLAWRFQAAPNDIKTVSLEQVESLWPVHGSILVDNDTAYFVAGRSTYLDGGLFLYGLDPLTGEVLHQRRLENQPAVDSENTAGIARKGFSQNAVDHKTLHAPDKSDAFSMDGNISDILVADGGGVYLRHMKFDRQLNRVDDWTHHLFSTSRLLDDNESYRAHWFYGNGDFRRLPVAYEWLTRGSYGGFSNPLGRFLVFDNDRLWGCGLKSLPLFTTDLKGIDAKLEKDFPKNKALMTHEPLATSLPIHPRAMIKAKDKLYIAGYPKDGSTLHRYGEPIRDKGVLLTVDASTGNVLARVDLPAPPTFDGMSAANGRLFMSLDNGSLISWK
jgi:outer membrane protein assembly factor BamB